MEPGTATSVALKVDKSKVQVEESPSKPKRKNSDESDASNLLEYNVEASGPEKIAIIQQASNGNVLAIEGGLHTTESNEIDRKIRCLKQLSLARKFRALMERAVQDAERCGSKEEALGILKQNKNIILQMTSLTDAVRGNYTQDSYDDYLVMNEGRRELKSHLSCQTAFADFRKKMAYEHSNDLSTIERREEQLARQNDLEKNADANGGQTADNQGDLSDAARGKKRRAEDSNKTSISPTAASINNSALLLSTSKKAKKSSPGKRQAASKPKKAKRPQRRICHYCKQSRKDFLPCQYWHPNGKQCKKTFCLNCLDSNSKFEYSRDEFFCPFCLSTCDCDACIRAQEAERQSSRSSSRRMTF